MRNWTNEEDLVTKLKNDFKANGIKATIRRERGGYTTSLLITIKTEDSDFIPFEDYVKSYKPCPKDIIYTDNHGMSIDFWTWQALPDNEKERIKAFDAKVVYNYQHEENAQINHYFVEKYDAFTNEFKAKLKKVVEICNSYNYDRSDSQTDYFEVGFYMNLRLRNRNLMEVA